MILGRPLISEIVSKEKYAYSYRKNIMGQKAVKLKAMETEIKTIDELKDVTLKGVLSINEEIGRGAYASVCTMKCGGVVCAVKKFHPNLIGSVSSKQQQGIKDNFIKECLCCYSIRHPNIVQFLGVYYPSDEPMTSLPVMVMELMDISLDKFIESNKSKINFCDKISILRDISLGLSFLHDCNPPILHCDLSSNNVMLTSELVAKIGDLGVAKMIQANSKQITVAPKSQHFMPPEALVADNPVYGTSTDVFSFGSIALHVFSEEWPTPNGIKMKFVSEELIVIIEVERRQQYLDKMTGKAASLKKMIEHCLDDHPNKRPLIQEVSKTIEPLGVGIAHYVGWAILRYHEL